MGVQFDRDHGRVARFVVFGGSVSLRMATPSWPRRLPAMGTVRLLQQAAGATEVPVAMERGKIANQVEMITPAEAPTQSEGI